MGLSPPGLILLKIAQPYPYLLIENPQFWLRRARSFIQKALLTRLIEPPSRKGARILSNFHETPPRAPKALVAGLNPPPARWRHWSLFTVLISIYWQKLANYANNADGNS